MNTVQRTLFFFALALALGVGSTTVTGEDNAVASLGTNRESVDSRGTEAAIPASARTTKALFAEETAEHTADTADTAETTRQQSVSGSARPYSADVLGSKVPFIESAGQQIATAFGVKRLEDVTRETVRERLLSEKSIRESTEAELSQMVYHWNVTKEEFSTALREWMKRVQRRDSDSNSDSNAAFAMVPIAPGIAIPMPVESRQSDTVWDTFCDLLCDIFSTVQWLRRLEDFSDTALHRLEDVTEKHFESFVHQSKCEQNSANCVPLNVEPSVIARVMRHCGAKEGVITKFDAWVASEIAQTAGNVAGAAMDSSEDGRGIAMEALQRSFGAKKAAKRAIHMAKGAKKAAAKAVKRVGKLEEQSRAQAGNGGGPRIVKAVAHPDTHVTVNVNQNGEKVTEGTEGVTRREHVRVLTPPLWTSPRHQRVWELLAFGSVLLFIGVSIAVCVMLLCVAPNRSSAALNEPLRPASEV